jgi:hypothetical protein
MSIVADDVDFFEWFDYPSYAEDLSLPDLNKSNLHSTVSPESNAAQDAMTKTLQKMFLVSTGPHIESDMQSSDPGMQAAASWEQSIPFATQPLSFYPVNITYQQSDVDSTDFWGPINSWIGQDKPSEDEILMQFITQWRCGYQCQVPVGDTGRPCGYIFSRRDRALIHVRVHFGMRPYTCQGACGVRGW